MIAPGGPGGIVQARVEEECLGHAGLQVAFEAVEVGAIVAPGNAHYLRATQPQQLHQVAVAGVVDHHPVARHDPLTDDQVQGLRGAKRGQYVICIQADGQARLQIGNELLAQRQVAGRVAVVDQGAMGKVGRTAHDACQCLGVAPRRWQPPAAELQALVVGME